MEQQQQQKSPAEMQMEALKEVEKMKAELKAKEAMVKAQTTKSRDETKAQIDAATAIMADDRMRDKDAMDYQVDVAEVSGKYNIAVNQAAVAAETERRRNYDELRQQPKPSSPAGSNPAGQTGGNPQG